MNNKQAAIINHLSSQQLKQQVWLTQFILNVLMITLAVLLFDNWQTFLSMFTWNGYHLVVFGVVSAIVIVFIDLVLMKFLPKKWWDDGGINYKLFKEGSYAEIIVLCFVIACTEELLFRGVLQSHFGLMVASLLFAVVHVRYLSKIVLFVTVIGLSFWIGLVFDWTGSLVVVITLHFLVDVMLALLIRTRRITNEG
ncbi:CPBP family intramembrane glutamic endopeptidase [Gracilibacillus sp. S3-1-1]|uniref:CPBP family intramembrane glutamic endopeptidase n=1 Tax=Gracilibacillus pellucidus TaxID=3095368 RepID=A0ACC6M554_9BACI|nr:CPBP family intramembrane glutamic endopeptidase [Gracilibacillus sp. S3-1-1]MDX8046095.1 CPBP family intramembrane glutamic endopeptidase [Gracilibacillus sp. S3-1-1]